MCVRSCGMNAFGLDSAGSALEGLAKEVRPMRSDDAAKGKIGF